MSALQLLKNVPIVLRPGRGESRIEVVRGLSQDPALPFSVRYLLRAEGAKQWRVIEPSQHFRVVNGADGAVDWAIQNWPDPDDAAWVPPETEEATT